MVNEDKQKSKPDLKLCPFCGGKAEMKMAYGYAEGWYIKCNKCNMKTLPILIDQPRVTYAGGVDESTRYTSEQAYKIAADLWNRRADEPVRHGRWLPYAVQTGPTTCCTAYRCSCCGREEEDNGEPYCHCGAKMDGGAEDGNQTDPV